MVGVSTSLCGDLPCLIPFQTFLVKKDTHQFCNCYSRMCIIQLECYFLREFMNIVMCSLEFSDCFLNTCRNKEILLFQAELFSCIVVIVRIKHVYNVLSQVFLFYCLLVITFIEGIQMEICDRLSIPYTECIYDIVIVSKNRNVKRYS